MDPPPGESMIFSYLCELLLLLGLYECFAAQATPENEWQETKKIWIVAIAILSCNTAVITTMPTTEGGLAQAVLILATLSFLLALILVIAPIAVPTLHMPNIKRFVLVSAGFVTACSYLTYVANKMGRNIARTSIAAIFTSGLFVSLVTILFLIRLILASPPPRPLAHPDPTSAFSCQSSLPSAPPTGESMT